MLHCDIYITQCNIVRWRSEVEQARVTMEPPMKVGQRVRFKPASGAAQSGESRLTRRAR